MKQILEGYERYIGQAQALIEESGIAKSELAGCDVLCYRVASNERYSELLNALMAVGSVIDESEVRGRLIAIVKLYEPIIVDGAELWYIEVPQPKPDSDELEGFDYVQYVVHTDINNFLARHSNIVFDTKAMDRPLHPQLKLKVGNVAVKFHDMNMGTVLRVEHRE